MEQSAFERLTEGVRAFFEKNDRSPKFVFVGLDAYKDIIDEHRNNREFYNSAKVRTVLGEREGIFAKAFGFSVLVLPINGLPTRVVADPEQVVF